MKKISFSFLAVIIMFALFAILPVGTAHATVTPTLSLVATGSGDSVQLNITGDPNTSVLLSYLKTGSSGQQLAPIGTTNANGYLTTTISTGSYTIAPSSPVYVIFGSPSGPQSAQVTWPAAASLLSSSNMISLSQTGLVLSVGQSSTITASNYNGTLYLSNNSSPQIANFSINGAQITVTANGYGNTTGTICLTSNTVNCASVYVIVQNGSAQSLTFSQNSIYLATGQTVSIQISGGSGNYLVANNSSQGNSLVTTSISGSTINLSTTSTTTGSASITVCSSDMTSCGIINVSIGNTSTTTTVSFSQPNPNVTVGQILNVSIYGPTSSLFYVASNSNPSIVQANLSGTTLSLLGITNGTSNISVCAASSNCGTLTVTVNSNNNGTGRVTLSQDTLSLSSGQSSNITISGGTMPYNTLFTPNNIFQAILNSNILTVTGLSSGSSSISVCSNGSCASLVVNVNGLSQVSNLPTGCASTAGYSQTTGVLCSTAVNLATPVLPADCTGSTMFSISTGLGCSNYVAPAPTPTVTSTTVAPATTSTSTASTSSITTSTAYKFTATIKLGSTGAEVIQLQKKLKALGFYSGKVDGGFGSATEKAVMAFQKKHGLPQVGSVGPLTRTALNK